MKIILLTYAKDEFKVNALDKLTQVAEARGHEVARVRYVDCAMNIEKSHSSIVYRGEVLNDIDAVIPWIIQGDFIYGISVLRHFESMGVFALNSSDAFTLAADKWMSAQRFALKGVPTPNTFRSLDYKAAQKFIDGMESECSIIKITTGTRGNGVILAESREAAKSIAGALGICRDTYIIQEFIKESSGTDIRAYVVDGKVVGAMERRASKGFRSNISLGGSGHAVQLTEAEAEAAVGAAKALDLRSAGVDLIRSNRGPLVVEANASGEFGIESVTGAEVAKTIIDYIEQNAKRQHKKDRVGA